MDAYFCYIHRPAKPVADLRILACDGDDELAARLDEMAADYPAARIEVFRDERLVTVMAAP